MEIERAHDYQTGGDLKVILICQVTSPDARPTVTRMAISTDFEKHSYRNFAELTLRIGTFLT